MLCSFLFSWLDYTDIHGYGRHENAASPSLSSSDLLSSYALRAWAVLPCTTQPRQSRNGEMKAELNCRSKS